MFHSPNLSINSENHLVIGQHDTVELAKKFGTPLYVLDEDLMRDNCRAYKNAIDTYYDGHGLVLFASKALCTMYTGRLVEEEGLGADVVSGGELYTLYKAGFPMEKVFFHGNNKTPDEIELALNCGVGHIVVDNKYELELLNRIANEKNVNQRILFRIKPGIDAHTHDFVKTGQIDSKFGVALENGEAYEIHKLALSMSNIQIDGVHCHIGSQIFDVEPFCEAAKVMIGFIADLYDKLGIKVKILNLGGGFGIKYTATDDPIAPSEYPAIISREFNMDFRDIGFSGMAKGEKVLAEWMAELPMSVFVCDYDHNAPTVEHLEATHYALYETIRAKNPDLPYIMVTRPDYWTMPCDQDAILRRRDVIMSSYLKARAAGDKNVYFIDGLSFNVAPHQYDMTMDSVHPNDSGFIRMADTIGTVIRHALERTREV